MPRRYRSFFDIFCTSRNGNRCCNRVIRMRCIVRSSTDHVSFFNKYVACREKENKYEREKAWTFVDALWLLCCAAAVCQTRSLRKPPRLRARPWTDCSDGQHRFGRLLV
ncbi:hypothetical protein CDAR_492521 [Caerostris darwini]|uniref:Uncharacterized protein n=1 Tax=Caerostris darwini TaxID=1538125 RepID=A0AAV4UZF4_9ARAC|nr:hypothetical protein CDAR_492521 [Caerostris darwini]